MTATLTREQAEASIAAAVRQRDTIQANLLVLDGSFGKRLLAGATLAGQTAKRWAAATTAQARLWEIYTEYAAVVDRAAEILARGRKPAAALAEAAALLTGASVRLADAGSPLASRDLTGTGSTALTLDAAVREMKRAFAGIAQVVTEAETVWNEIADQLQHVADQLEAAGQDASGLADGAFGAALAVAQSGLDQLRGLLNSDPLAFWQGGRVDTARLGPLQQQAAAVRAQAAELARLRADADARIAAVAAVLAGARAAWQDTMAARERAEARIAGVLPPPPEVASLVSRAAALDGLKAAGRWSRLASELGIIEEQAVAVTGHCRAAERDALALLDRRDELRGMLDAYRARAARLGAAEDPGLEAGYEHARELLWTAPCDLQAAGAAVTSYQQGVLALSGRGQP
jgi:hypothetical protein